MEEIAKWHLKTVKEDFKKKQLPAEHEQKQLVEYKKQREIEEKEQRKREILHNLSAQGLKPKKLAKGPNPLSVKKQKRDKFQKQQDSNLPERKKRIRKRKPKESNGGAHAQES